MDDIDFNRMTNEQLRACILHVLNYKIRPVYHGLDAVVAPSAHRLSQFEILRPSFITQRRFEIIASTRSEFGLREETTSDLSEEDILRNYDTIFPNWPENYHEAMRLFVATVSKNIIPPSPHKCIAGNAREKCIRWLRLLNPEVALDLKRALEAGEVKVLSERMQEVKDLLGWEGGE